MLRPQEPGKGAEINHFAAVFSRPGADVEDVIRSPDELGIVLDHDERVARIAQFVQHPDQAPDVARVEADARLVEDEKRIDK